MSTLRVAFLSALVLELAAAAGHRAGRGRGRAAAAGRAHAATRPRCWSCCSPPRRTCRCARSAPSSTPAPRAPPRPSDVFEILDTPVPRPQPRARTAARRSGPAPPPAPLTCGTTLSCSTGVSLAYPGRDRAGPGRVNLTIRPGDRITLTGPSGAGKSSLLALLLRFAEPTGGRIEAGGVRPGPISRVDWPWRRQIAWVPQHPYLFAGTVAEQHRARPARTRPGGHRARPRRPGRRGRVHRGRCPVATHTAGASAALRLSAGQRQQIALARAFLQDAPLLLLDEPAAHLDPVSARLIERRHRAADGRPDRDPDHARPGLGRRRRPDLHPGPRQARARPHGPCFGLGPAAHRGSPAAARLAATS